MNLEERKKKILEISKKVRIDNVRLSTGNPAMASVKFLTPNKKCDLCCSSIAYTVNDMYLKKAPETSIAMFAKQLNQKLRDQGYKGKVSKAQIIEHFDNHFNAQGAAQQAYINVARSTKEEMKKEIEEDKTKELAKISPKLLRVYELLEDKFINEIKVLDFALKEQLEHYTEIKQMRIEKERDNLPGVEELIMREEEIIKNIQSVSLSKIKTFQQGKLHQAQANAISSFSSLNAQTANLLGIDTTVLNPIAVKKSQFLFVNTVISKFLGKVKICLDALGITSEQKAQFYGELKKQLKGVENEIFNEFETIVKDSEITKAESETK